MKKAKKTKTSQRHSELDRIATRLRTMLRRDTTSVIEKGKLLLEAVSCLRTSMASGCRGSPKISISAIAPRSGT
jgi:hypothetical protein